VIAQVNPRMPRTHGDGLVHVAGLTPRSRSTTPLPEHRRHAADRRRGRAAIGRHVAALIEDGATLQMGIGAIPDAVLAALGTTATSASTPRCSRTACCRWSSAGVITGSAQGGAPRQGGRRLRGWARAALRLRRRQPAGAMLDIGYVNDAA
jgi:4-hydroxybutyrate CoA-transferase